MKRTLQKKKTPGSRKKSGKLISVQFVEVNPDPKKIPDGKLVVVWEKAKHMKWAYLKCPSGCGDPLMMSLQKGDYPSWGLIIDKDGRPSLVPSIRKKDGCKSHFFLTKGKILYVTSRYRRFSAIPILTEEID